MSNNFKGSSVIIWNWLNPLNQTTKAKLLLSKFLIHTVETVWWRHHSLTTKIDYWKFFEVGDDFLRISSSWERSEVFQCFFYVYSLKSYLFFKGNVFTYFVSLHSCLCFTVCLCFAVKINNNIFRFNFYVYSFLHQSFSFLLLLENGKLFFMFGSFVTPKICFTN